MPKPIEPLHTATGQRQRAERAAKRQTVKLTRKRIEKAMQQYETITKEQNVPGTSGDRGPLPPYS